MQPTLITTGITTGIALLLMAAAPDSTQADETAQSSKTSTARATFDALDQNGDGTIVAAEVQPAQKSAFQQLLRVSDANKDGNLSLAEFLTGLNTKDRQPEPAAAQSRSRGRGSSRPNFAQQLFQRYDRNQDGKLEKSELPEDAGPTLRGMFERLGKDTITTDDLSRFSSRASGRPDLTQALQRWDANRDGKLTPEEIPERARPLVAGLLRRAGKSPTDTLTLEDLKQTDQSGQRTRSRSTPSDRTNGNRPEMRRDSGTEQSSRRPANVSGAGLPALLQTLDTNGDGQLDRTEFARLSGLFDKLDSNRDGQIAPRELFGARSLTNNTDRSNTPQSRNRSSQRSSAGRPEPSGRQRSTGNISFLLRRFDRNQDGRLARDEVQGRLKDNFDKVDADGDGFLSNTEIQSAASARNAPQRPSRSQPSRESDRARKNRQRPPS